MTPERWQQIQSIFHAALEREPEERSAFLSDACSDDPSLRSHVEELLAADDAPDSVFGASPEDLARAADLSEPTLEGQTIGPYRLIRELGRGGMGTVFLASRADGQFDKEVALKLVKPGMDSEEILRRFRYERQILAALDHDNVARLYDGGIDDHGRPYLVMEYVSGKPIDVYCDENSLLVEERLKLFETVCRAVQFAHQNLVVHRDLKPSNILVTEDGTAKLLDFGIAKLLSEEEDPSAPITRTGIRVMTPQYASPEQVRGETVTTATDVYSLGVVLYELLTGQRPYGDAVTSKSEMEKAVLEQEPERPSSAVIRTSRASDEDNKAPQPGFRMAADARQLRKRLQGDIDTMLLKALRKESPRRYSSAGALADDIRRHLDGLPVEAQADTLRYRTTKFVRRHRFGATAAMAFVVLLVVFASAMVLQQAETARERDRAEAERDKAEEVATFLQALFDASDPFLSDAERLDTMQVRQFLDRGAERIEREMEDEPEVLARMEGVIGNVYKSLGLYDKAGPLLSKSLETRIELHGENHADVAESLESLGDLALATSDYPAAEGYFRRAIEIRETEDASSLPHAAALKGLASALRRQGSYDESETLIREALALQQEHAGPEDPEVAMTLFELGRVYQDRGNLAEAESLYRDVLGRHRRLFGDEHPQVASTIDNLATTLRQETKLSEAEPLTREALAIRRKVLGPEHPQTLSSLYELASIARDRDNYDEAVTLFNEVIDLDKKVLGEGHHYVGLDLRELGITYTRMGAYDEALDAYDASLEILRAALPEDHMDISVAIVGIGHVYLRKGDLDRAETILREGLDMNIRTLGEASWHTGVSKSVLGECLMRQGRLDEAEPLLVDGYETLRDGQGPTETALRRLVAFYEMRDDAARVDQYRRLLGEDAG